MKGKHSAASATRRAHEAADQIQSLKTELADTRTAHHREREQLKAEIRQLRAAHTAEASRLAAEEVQRRIAAHDEAMRVQGLTIDVARHLMVQKDRMIRNACRYVSMTTGVPPHMALSTVMTWVTDKDFYGFSGSVRMLAEIGIHPDGWVGQMIRIAKNWDRAETRRSLKTQHPAAFALDRAVEELPERIHKQYRPEWYPPVRYQGLQVTDS